MPTTAGGQDCEDIKLCLSSAASKGSVLPRKVRLKCGEALPEAGD